MAHDESLPIPTLPETYTLSDNEDDNNEQSDSDRNNDPEVAPPVSSTSHLKTKEELHDLVGDLNLSKVHSELLRSRLQEVWCLRNVSLLVLPPAVQRGQNAVLLCQYDLEGAPLYSVKWYRGRHEFYRYSPQDNPPNKIFPFPGGHEGNVVDLSMSNSSQVVVQQVGFNLSGNLSCEVTADAPSFTTAVVSRQLMVVDLPDSDPLIETEKDRYDPGDILRANCTSPPSKPPASLSFLLNNIPVGTPETRNFPAADLLQSSSLTLTIQLLPSHFHNGQLVLKCTALVATLYRESTQVQLGVTPKEPVPERVTSPNLTSRTSTTSVHLVLFLVASCIAR